MLQKIAGEKDVKIDRREDSMRRWRENVGSWRRRPDNEKSNKSRIKSKREDLTIAKKN